MKKLSQILLSTLLIGTSTMAMSAKPKFVEGTTEGKYQKPGAPVDMRYRSQSVEVGESSQVYVALLSSETTGVMNVKITIDKNMRLENKVPTEQDFKLNPGQREYPLDLIVSAYEDGLYYIRILVSIEGKGMRAFAVPVHVGDAKITKESASIVEKTSKGENISVSPAVETIQR